MVDTFLQFFGIDLLSIVTFLDLLPILVRLFVGVWVLRLFFNFISVLSPMGRNSVFRGM